MKKIILFYAFIITAFNVNAQQALAKWDKIYKMEDSNLIIKYEINYAKRVEKDTLEARYYVALKKCRF